LPRNTPWLGLNHLVGPHSRIVEPPRQQQQAASLQLQIDAVWQEVGGLEQGTRGAGYVGRLDQRFRQTLVRFAILRVDVDGIAKLDDCFTESLLLTQEVYFLMVI
jgi:hypothetical protein